MRRLHIGGDIAKEGWEILNINPGPGVDHVGNAADLSRFADASFTEVYASHVLEHLDYTGELQRGLAEWRRVLRPSGRLYVSVPDLDALARMLLDRENLNSDERFFVMRMIFGGHSDRWDYHIVGLNKDFLTRFLRAAGFVNIRRVRGFDLFADLSADTFKGIPISLNMIAEASA